MKTLCKFITLATITLALPVSGIAAEKKEKAAAAPAAEAKKPAEKAAPAAAPAKEEAKADRPIPYHGVVAAVDATAKTFTFKNKAGKERVFAVSDKTEIMKDGAKADFAAVTVGAYATGQYNKTADGKLDAVSVKIGPKPEKKAKTEDEKPAEKK